MQMRHKPLLLLLLTAGESVPGRLLAASGDTQGPACARYRCARTGGACERMLFRCCSAVLIKVVRCDRREGKKKVAKRNNGWFDGAQGVCGGGNAETEAGIYGDSYFEAYACSQWRIHCWFIASHRQQALVAS